MDIVIVLFTLYHMDRSRKLAACTHFQSKVEKFVTLGLLIIPAFCF